MVWDSGFGLTRARPGTCWLLQDKERKKGAGPGLRPRAHAGINRAGGWGGERRVVPVDQTFQDNPDLGVPTPAAASSVWRRLSNLGKRVLVSTPRKDWCPAATIQAITPQRLHHGN